MIYMGKKCYHCWAELEADSEFCNSCRGKNITKEQVDNKFVSYSNISFVLGCIAIGFFSWFAFLSGYLGFAGIIGCYIFNSLFLLSTLLGVVLGSISIKQGIRKRAILGIVFNIFDAIWHMYALIALVLLSQQQY